MARSEARISVDIWSDADFLALAPGPQRLYLFLISQPDIAHDGVLPLRERRWSSGAAGLSATAVHADLAVLADARFVVLDEDHEELLVRSFIRRDDVYRQPNLMAAARKHLPFVASPEIRAALAVELRRIRGLDDVPERSLRAIDEMLAELHVEPPPNPSPNPSPKASPNPSSGAGGDRGMVTAVVSASPSPYALSPVPLPLPPPAGASPRRKVPGTDLVSRNETTAQTLIGEWIDHCRSKPPGTVIGQVGKQLKAMLAEGIDPGDVRAGLAAWHGKGLHPSALPSVVNELMNAGNGRASPRASTTDAKVAATLALAAELDRKATA